MGFEKHYEHQNDTATSSEPFASVDRVALLADSPTKQRREQPNASDADAGAIARTSDKAASEGAGDNLSKVGDVIRRANALLDSDAVRNIRSFELRRDSQNGLNFDLRQFHSTQ